MNAANLGSSGPGGNTLTYRTGNTLIKATTTFNSYFTWVVDGSAGGLDVQNVATHELGHWLNLKDINTAGCESATMWYQTWPGDTSRRSLSFYDVNAINWQYP